MRGAVMDYLLKNKTYWEKGYPAINVDHTVFRFYGKILKPEFKLGGNWERLIDFGCGQGATVNFFRQLGFNACGVDMSENDITTAKIRYPHISSSFYLCAPEPKSNPYYGFDKDVKVVTAFQSLYYLSDKDFQACMDILYRSMQPGAVFFATMMGEGSLEFFDNSTEFKDGLRSVNFQNSIQEVKDYYISFIKDEDHLKRKFGMFKPVHIGHYSAKFRNDEGDGFHYTFCGVK